MAQGEGQGIWFFNGLLTIKAGGDDTRNAFALIECKLPAGDGPPPQMATLGAVVSLLAALALPARPDPRTAPAAPPR